MLSCYDDLKHIRVPEIRSFLFHKLTTTRMPSYQTVLFPSFRELWPLFLSRNQNLHVLEGWVVSYLCLKSHLILWYSLSWKHTPPHTVITLKELINGMHIMVRQQITKAELKKPWYTRYRQQVFQWPEQST